MKKLIILLLCVLGSCSSNKNVIQKSNNFSGVYYLESNKLYQVLSDMNYSAIEIYEDGTYVLNKARIRSMPVLEQCEYASKGKWSVLADNIIEITSENYYTEQRGFEYNLKKDNKLSQDSLYIKVVFPTDFHPVNLDFTFNHQNNKSFATDKTQIVLPKSEYLWDRRTTTNQISFNLNADVSGIDVYKGRILFNIFEKSIDTEKYNYLTITLPNFDRCFFEFEPFYQDLILIKNKNTIIWRGNTWSK